MRPIVNKIQIILVALILVGSTENLWAGSKPSKKTAKIGYEKLETLAQVLHFVETNYLHAKDNPELIDFAIKGIVEHLDRYSRYFSKEEFEREQAKERKRALGLGIEWRFRQKRCFVSGLRSGSVADRAVVRVGEEIFSLNGLSPVALGKAAVTKLLSQRSGKWTRLGVQGIEVEPRVVRIAPPESELIHLKSLDSGVAVLRIGQFFLGADKVVREALSKLTTPPRGLIIDLRGNTGGVVEEAVRISDFWLDKGLISTMVDPAGRRSESRARPAESAAQYPIVVLIDGRTASAAEVLAAALSQNRRAKLVGTQSFGKATVQTLIRMTDGSALRLTVGRLLTPAGHSIEGVGLVPDFEVLPGRLADGKDRQFAQAVEAVLYPR